MSAALNGKKVPKDTPKKFYTYIDININICQNGQKGPKKVKKKNTARVWNCPDITIQ